MRSRKTAITFPAARADGLLIEHVGDETVVFDVDAKEAHCLKGLASVVFASADGKTSAEDLAAHAEKTLGTPVTYANLQEAISQLEACALLDTPLLVRDGLSRRDLVKKAGYVGAAATVASPLITSLIAPSSALAASSIATGCAGCGKNPDCVSNHCCQSNAGKDCSQGCCVGANNSCHFCNCTAADVCDCTVTPADAGITVCPCICGTAGCVNVPCCPSVNLLCCTATPAC
jgi:hypothetical protein